MMFKLMRTAAITNGHLVFVIWVEVVSKDAYKKI